LGTSNLIKLPAGILSLGSNSRFAVEIEATICEEGTRAALSNFEGTMVTLRVPSSCSLNWADMNFFTTNAPVVFATYGFPISSI
jgi:hypothetical protein